MRVLPVLNVEPPSGPIAAYLATAAPVRFGEGFHAEELADGLPFRWMSLAGRIDFTPAETERFIEIDVRSHFYDLSQRVAVFADGRPLADHELVRGWNLLSVPLPLGATSVRLEANKIFPRAHYPGDVRELVVQVRSALLHGDPVRHGHISRQHANAALNLRELLDGRTRLASTPPKLGIDIQGACNVKPPCVYCAWDFSKSREGANVELPFTAATLKEYGECFENSVELVNCSIGEPFMGKNLDELLDAFGERGKVLEMTTNGQVLTDGNIRRLLGRNVHLYVSLDAATAETYARLRNDRFDQLLANLRRLVAAKGGPGHLPLVYAVFMPMRANVHEIDAFIRLCAELRVDRVVLRPLNDAEGMDLVWDRAGYHFEYQKELLPWGELVRISGRVAEMCRRLGIELSDQLDFGGSMEAQFAQDYAAGRREAAALFEEPAPAAVASTAPAQALPSSAPAPEPVLAPDLGEQRLPACTEPWSSLYILRRGVRPCCYGGGSVAKMGEFKEAWNSPLLQAIRSDLLRGTFHRYCFDSPDCPIVKKSREARTLSAREVLFLRYRRLWDRVKRSTHGWRRRNRR